MNNPIGKTETVLLAEDKTNVRIPKISLLTALQRAENNGWNTATTNLLQREKSHVSFLPPANTWITQVQRLNVAESYRSSFSVIADYKPNKRINPRILLVCTYAQYYNITVLF